MDNSKTLERAAKLIAKDQTYCWHPYTQAKTAPLPLPVEGAKGAEIILSDGSTLIDATSSWWVNLHGHNHPHITSCIKKQLSQLDHVMFADLTHEPAANLAENLSSILPGNPQRIFFSDNGSTAVETALKIAFQYWHNLNPNTKKRKAIAFRNGYHGETFGAMAVSCPTLFTKPFKSMLFDVEIIDPPIPGKEEKSIQQLQNLLKTDEFACFVFEPKVQAAGGMLTHSMQGLSQLIELCHKHKVLTIADEVFTGCGRLGSLFTSHELSIPPNLICLAKTLTGGILPLGITSCTEEIFEAFLSVNRNQALLHGHSYCANPIGCAAALASLQLLQTSACTSKREAITKSHHKIAKKWKNHPKLKRVEVVGTLLVTELSTKHSGNYFDSSRDQLSEFFLKQGVLMRPLGNTIHTLPPYCINNEQLEKIYQTMEESFEIYFT